MTPTWLPSTTMKQTYQATDVDGTIIPSITDLGCTDDSQYPAQYMQAAEMLDAQLNDQDCGSGTSILDPKCAHNGSGVLPNVSAFNQPETAEKIRQFCSN